MHTHPSPWHRARRPYDDAAWKAQRVAAMRTAVRGKFSPQHAALRELLIATYPHPLIALTPDPFWGFDLSSGGENQLGALLMELRAEAVRSAK